MARLSTITRTAELLGDAFRSAVASVPMDIRLRTWDDIATSSFVCDLCIGARDPWRKHLSGVLLSYTAGEALRETVVEAVERVFYVNACREGIRDLVDQ